MAKLAEPLMGIKETGKVPNRKVPNRELFLTKGLRLYNSIVIVVFTLKVTPMNCAYFLAALFR